MEFMFTLLMSILWGYICYKMAEKRGRDTVIAAILGACFGVFAVVGYAIAGYKTPPTTPTV
jgi:predicted permease